MKVLVIDDDTLALALIRESLERTGRHAISLASDGSAGLKLIKRDPPDLLFIDWLMPSLSGVDVLRELAGEAASKMPGYIVMMSSAPDLEMLKPVAFELGAHEVVPKPLGSSDIAGMIERAGAVPANPRR